MIEKFMIAEDWDPASRKITVGDANRFVTMKPHPGSLGTVNDVRDGKIDGWLVSSAAMVKVRDLDGQQGVILIERDGCAPVDPHKWQFPGGRVGPKELPANTAFREALEEVLWPDPAMPAYMPESGETQDYIFQVDGKDYQAASHGLCVDAENKTLEFVTCFDLQVEKLDDVKLADAEPYGRTIRIVKGQELAKLHAQDKLTAVTRWAAHHFGIMDLNKTTPQNDVTVRRSGPTQAP